MAKFEAFTYAVIGSRNVSELVKEVNQKLGQGYKPVGGICFAPITESLNMWYQAMAKPVKPTYEPLSTDALVQMTIITPEQQEAIEKANEAWLDPLNPIHGDSLEARNG